MMIKIIIPIFILTILFPYIYTLHTKTNMSTITFSLNNKTYIIEDKLINDNSSLIYKVLDNIKKLKKLEIDHLIFISSYKIFDYTKTLLIWYNQNLFWNTKKNKLYIKINNDIIDIEKLLKYKINHNSNLNKIIFNIIYTYTTNNEFNKLITYINLEILKRIFFLNLYMYY